jgi:hypothetical protein
MNPNLPHMQRPPKIPPKPNPVPHRLWSYTVRVPPRPKPQEPRLIDGPSIFDINRIEDFIAEYEHIYLVSPDKNVMETWIEHKRAPKPPPHKVVIQPLSKPEMRSTTIGYDFNFKKLFIQFLIFMDWYHPKNPYV